MQLGDEDVSASLLSQNVSFDPGGEKTVGATFAGLVAEHSLPKHWKTGAFRSPSSGRLG